MAGLPRERALLTASTPLDTLLCWLTFQAPPTVQDGLFNAGATVALAGESAGVG